MDNELLDIFTHKLLSDIPVIQEQLSVLATDKDTSVPILFRIFHNYKASSSYLEIHQLYLLVSQGENILNALRLSQDEASKDDLKWLDSCLSQLQIWCEQLLAGDALSPLKHSLFPTITILDESEKTSEIMQGLTLLYADGNAERAKKMQAPLEHVFRSVQTVGTIEDIKCSVLENTCDIVILNMHESSIEI